MPVAWVGPEPAAAFYLRQAALHGGPILILGCGPAQLAFALAARGHQVVAVDPSESMIALAEQRRQLEPRLGENLRLLHSDIRSLRLGERFPLVLAPHNALCLMSSPQDLAAAFATARLHLEDEGTLAFDVLNAAPAQTARSGHRMDYTSFRPTFIPHLRERQRSRTEERRAIHRLRLYHFTPADLEAALAQAQLAALERFGQFDGKAFDDDDPLQIIVAQPTP